MMNRAQKRKKHRKQLNEANQKIQNLKRELHSLRVTGESQKQAGYNQAVNSKILPHALKAVLSEVYREYGEKVHDVVKDIDCGRSMKMREISSYVYTGLNSIDEVSEIKRLVVHVPEIHHEMRYTTKD